jgi:hypothetical protein
MIPASQGNVRWGDEELPMTMQVGMVGSDGIVIASDLKWGGDSGGSRETHLAPKIKVNDALGIGVACSEAEVSLNIATDILNQFKESDHEYPCLALERIARGGMDGFDRARATRPQSHCLIALRGKPFRLYSLRVGPEGQNCTEVFDRRRAGDPGNPAMFFAQAYYSPRPISELTFLAAHVVLTAPRFNSDGIGGLEILSAHEETGFRMLSSDEIEELKERSSALHETISRALFSAPK